MKAGLGVLLKWMPMVATSAEDVIGDIVVQNVWTPMTSSRASHQNPGNNPVDLKTI